MFSANNPQAINAPDLQGWTPLHHAACEGQLETVRQLLTLKANVHLKDDEGWTPLHLAAANGHTLVVGLLLERGANIHARDGDGRSPLQRACYYGQKETVAFLLARGAKLEDRDGKNKTPLHAAVSSYKNCQGRWAVIRFLVEEKRANLEAETDIGWTPLHSAVRYSDIASIELLLTLGANKEAKNNYGHTPLIMVCYEDKLHPDDRLAVVNLLLRYQVQIDNQDNKKFTALHMTCIRGFKTVAERLLRAGANPNALSDDGQKPLHYAAKYGHAELVSLLSEPQTFPKVVTPPPVATPPVHSALSALSVEAKKKESSDTSKEVLSVESLREEVMALRDLIARQNELIIALQRGQEAMHKEIQILKLQQSQSKAFSSSQNTNAIVPAMFKKS